jgi:hypothetical protein
MKANILPSILAGICCAFVALGVASLIHVWHPEQSLLGLFGKHDFVAFWSGFQAFWNGENPYLGQDLLHWQQEVNDSISTPLYFLNPPHTLYLFSPILVFPFPLASDLWYFCNVLLMSTSTFLSLRCCRTLPLLPSILVATSIAILPPISVLFMIGQLTGIILLGFLSLYHGLQRRSLVISIFGILCLLVKPQFLFGTALYLLYHYLSKKRDSTFMRRLFVALSITGVLYLGLFWKLILKWFQIDFSPLNTKTFNFFVLLLHPYREHIPLELGLIAMLMVQGILIWLLLSRIRLQDSFAEYAWLMAISTLFAPYSLLYDLVLFLPLFLVTLSRLHRAKWRFLLFHFLGAAFFITSRHQVPLFEYQFLIGYFYILLVIDVFRFYHKTSCRAVYVRRRPNKQRIYPS